MSAAILDLIERCTPQICEALIQALLTRPDAGPARHHPLPHATDVWPRRQVERRRAMNSSTTRWPARRFDLLGPLRLVVHV
jgi:hypothetical protein